jgi:hypothetical protein
LQPRFFSPRLFSKTLSERETGPDHVPPAPPLAVAMAVGKNKKLGKKVKIAGKKKP